MNFLWMSFCDVKSTGSTKSKSSFVIDAMIGQEAANVAREFNAQLA